MQIKTQFYIRNNPYIANYLRENSHWYKTLNRNPSSILELEKEMKEAYHLTPQDRLENLGQRIEIIKNFMELLN